jgi:homoserine kinase
MSQENIELFQSEKAKQAPQTPNITKQDHKRQSLQQNPYEDVTTATGSKAIPQKKQRAGSLNLIVKKKVPVSGLASQTVSQQSRYPNMRGKAANVDSSFQMEASQHYGE